MRVHEAAKKYKLTKDELIVVLGKAGFVVRSHMSGMTDEMVEAVERHANKGKPRAKTKTKAPKTEAKKPAAKVTARKAKEKQTIPKKTKPPVKTKPTVKAKPDSKAKLVAKAKSEAKAKPDKKAKPEAKTQAQRGRPTRFAAGAPKSAAGPAAKKPQARRGTSGGKTVRVTKPPAPARGARVPKRRQASSSEAQQKAVRESVRRTLAKIEVTRRTRRRKGKSRGETTSTEPPIRISEGATIRELGELFKLDANEIIRRCLDLGVTATIGQSLDKETIELVADDFDKNIQFVSDEVENLLRVESKIDPTRLEPRAPIVTVMGHVDHGKTSILDYIRKTRVASGEAGGITQHIGSYQVVTPGGNITFIDTPGHEAFTSMRARGAQVTDIVVLVVAADDGVMPQTIEAINHARAADVPIIVALNKMDLPGADAARIRQQLTESDVVIEEFGGEVVSVEVSAKTGEGIDKLLEMILLQSELLELRADKRASAQAVAVEVKKEEGRGILCTVLVTQGTLRIGDTFVIGANYGKVRALLDHLGYPQKSAGPATPVLVLGCNGLPEAGDKLVVVREEREARELSVRRQQAQKSRDRTTAKKLTLDELYAQIQSGELKELRLLVKGDTNGSVEALTQSLEKLSIEDVVVKILHSGVGVVSESDVLLAASSDAIIIGFNVKVAPKAREAADREKVEVKTYDVIYECITDVDDAMKGLLDPERVERILGRAEVRKVFKIAKLGVIGGSFVTEGSITRNSLVRVVRDSAVVFEGRISSLKRFQDDAREVQKDFECGIGITGFNDLREGDIFEAFVVEEKARVF
ncbi:MAG: translation initiation factor IF-2 [Candidatus Krumholzibacteria bacterium]|nr:translation initiation factor IF-2 [Candidatus Krumholzibacteria bacterium]